MKPNAIIRAGKPILIIHTWGIGDWLFFTPVLAALRMQHPQSPISVLLGTPSTAQALRLYPEVDDFAVGDVRRGAWTTVLPLLRLLRHRPEILLFTAGIDSRRADLFASIVPAKIKVGLRTHTHRPYFLNRWDDFSDDVHMVENNAKFFDLLSLPRPASIRTHIPRPEGIRPEPGSVVLHPGSDPKHPYKRWPVDRFVALAQRLLAEGRKVSAVLGPGELDLASAFSPLDRTTGFKCYQNLIFKDLVEQIALHEFMVNSDSGPGHIASALGLKVLSIIGPGVPEKVRPYGQGHAIVMTDDPIECMPCFRRDGRHGCYERPCVMSISLEKVFLAFKGLESHSPGWTM